MSTAKGRYGDLDTYHVVDRRGRSTAVLPPAPRRAEPVLGYHRRVESERLDQIAARYLKDPAGFWRIADANDAMLPDALTEVLEIAIPGGDR